MRVAVSVAGVAVSDDQSCSNAQFAHLGNCVAGVSVAGVAVAVAEIEDNASFHPFVIKL